MLFVGCGEEETVISVTSASSCLGTANGAASCEVVPEANAVVMPNEGVAGVDTASCNVPSAEAGTNVCAGALERPTLARSVRGDGEGISVVSVTIALGSMPCSRFISGVWVATCRDAVMTGCGTGNDGSLVLVAVVVVTASAKRSSRVKAALLLVTVRAVLTAVARGRKGREGGSIVFSIAVVTG